MPKEAAKIAKKAEIGRNYEGGIVKNRAELARKTRKCLVFHSG